MRRPLRRRYIVRPFQYRLILHQALYLLLVVAGTYFLVVDPLLETVGDDSLTIDRRAKSAEFLLHLDGRVFPVLAALLALVFLHSTLVSHRIAGPIYRFAQIFRSIAGGDLSMRVKIRRRDYLQDEAREFDEAVSGLRSRLKELRDRARDLERALEPPAQGAGLPSAALAKAQRAAAGIRAELDGFALDPPGVGVPPGAREAA